MLFTIIEVVNDKVDASEILTRLLDLPEIFPSYSENKTLLYFTYNSENNLICIPIIFRKKLFLLLNTFDGEKAQTFKSFIQTNIGLSMSNKELHNDSFKNLINSKSKIVEISAIINDQIVEEISISGSDLQNSSLYDLIMDKGHIRKIVLYADEIGTDKIAALVKIFSDGKFSIIPEIDIGTVVSLVSDLFERFKLEQ